MSSYGDHQRMVTLEQRVATLEVRAAELERVNTLLQTEMEALKQRPAAVPQPVTIPVDQPIMHSEPASPYEQWREKKAARKAAE